MIYYYSDDGTKFHSKIKALEYCSHKSQNIHLYYYDDIYSKIDWTIEPPESLDYYYVEQAKRLRDTYDYLILCYSGGYDSTNILETFHFNNIKLDKIITVGAFDQDSFTGSDENHNGEIYMNVFPYLDELGLKDITQVIDYTKLFNDKKNLSILQYGENWIDYTGAWFSPHNWFWHDLEKHVVPKEWKSNRVGIIFGKDKPTIPVYPMNKCTQTEFCFMDRPVTSYGNITAVDNCERINFYWDPNYPEILLKQLHLIHRHKSLHANQSIRTDDIIYNLRKKLIFKSPKSRSSMISLRDSFLKNIATGHIHDLHSKGMSNIQNLNYPISKHITTKTYNFKKNVV